MGNDAASHGGNRGRLPRWISWPVQLLVVILLIGGLRLWMQGGMAEGHAPNIDATTLDGTRIQLADYAGEPLLLHFWAIWCGVCALTQPGIDQLAKDRPVLTVALRSGDRAAVRRHMADKGFDHRVILDENGTLAERFGVRGVPASFLIDGEQRIAFRNTGVTPAWELRLRMAGLRWFD